MFAIVMMPETHRHMDTEEMERYSLGKLGLSDVERIEEHLLVCEQCRRQLEETELYVKAMRQASEELGLQPKRRPWWRRNAPAMTLAACAIAIVVLALPRPAQLPPLAVDLQATRSDTVQTAPAGRPLWLRPDLTGLPPVLSYRLEVVDRDGGPTWGGIVIPADAGANIPRQRPGTYFIRVYTRGDELLREYTLEIK